VSLELVLPESARAELKEPMGTVYTDAEALLADAGDPVFAVGDVVTAHLVRAGRRPDLAVVDERTERAAVADDVAADLPAADVTVANPAATLTGDLLSALADAAAAEEPRTVMVDGEEDLAALPAILLAPDGAAVVYGQPGEGMVLVTVDDAARERTRDLFDLLAGDVAAGLDALGVAE
jgi:uncharacterized protein (UPF0218 family)